jgi:predicted ArsR family transcriptional regulator
MTKDAFEESIAALAVLEDPVRRRLYRYVAGRADEVSRNEAAQAVGVQRGLAAFHLDKLVDAGLLEVSSYRRLSRRSGPGAGRPAKLYRRVAATEHVVSVPPRGYDRAALLLAEAVEEAGADLELQAAARRLGAALGREEPATDVVEALARHGYEPYREGAEVRLRNCPFHRLAREFPTVTCGMNLALAEGLLAGLGVADLRAVLDPRPGACCVALVPLPQNSK